MDTSDITVVIGTFGSSAWSDLARTRALPSVEAQCPDVNVLHVHGTSLAQARNAGAWMATTEWLVFLDADDELAPGYLVAMTTGKADLRGPTVEYLRSDGTMRRVLHQRIPLQQGNFLPIGTLVPRRLFHEVGGFHEWELYEDWDLWIRCQARGATIEQIPDAVYRAHVRQDSRNEPDRETKLKLFNAIREAHFGAVA